MNTWFTRLATGTFAVAILGFSSCKKDESMVMLQSNANPTFSTSTTTPNLVASNTTINRKAITLTFTKADFGYPAAINYEYQFDKKGGNFSSPVTIAAGTTAKTDTLTTSQLIQAFSDLGLPYAASAQVDMRVVATVGTTAPAMKSPTITLTGTPTPVCTDNNTGRTWSLIGPAGTDWNTDIPLTYDCYSQSFKGRLTLKVGEFKFRANNGWTVNFGTTNPTANVTMSDLSKGYQLVNDKNNLQISEAGTYSVNLAPSLDGTSGKVTIKK